MSDPNFRFFYDGIDFSLPTQYGELVGCKWIPENEKPKFILIYIHDSGVFLTINHDIFDEILVKNGAVYGCDHFGHGRSPGERLACTIEHVIDEISGLIKLASNDFPSVPIFLMGKTFGALAIMRAVILFSKDTLDIVSGVILETPWITRWSFKNIGIFDTMKIQIMNKLFPNHIYDHGAEYLTSEAIQLYAEKCEQCSLYIPHMTPTLYLSAMETITSARYNIEYWPSNLPTLFLIANRDQILDSEDIKNVLNEYMIQPFTIKTYDSPNELTKTHQRHVVMSDILSFIIGNLSNE